MYDVAKVSVYQAWNLVQIRKYEDADTIYAASIQTASPRAGRHVVDAMMGAEWDEKYGIVDLLTLELVSDKVSYFDFGYMRFLILLQKHCDLNIIINGLC